MDFRAFMAEIATHPIDFTPIVQGIDRLLQYFKGIEPHLDQPLFMYKQNYGSDQDVILYFYNSLHEIRELVSRGAHDLNLSNVVDPVFKKIIRAIEELKQKPDKKAVVEKYHMRELL